MLSMHPQKNSTTIKQTSMQCILPLSLYERRACEEKTQAKEITIHIQNEMRNEHISYKSEGKRIMI
jgi:hypothetical protein